MLIFTRAFADLCVSFSPTECVLFQVWWRVFMEQVQPALQTGLVSTVPIAAPPPPLRVDGWAGLQTFILCKTIHFCVPFILQIVKMKL